MSHARSELMPTNRRLEFFSDAVFAIVITLMVIEIEIPSALALGNAFEPLSGFLIFLATYVLSFILIANLWVSHHYLIFTIARPRRSTIWFNNHLLLWITMIPLATRFLGLHPNSSRAAAVYGLVALGCTTAFMLLRSHAARTTNNPLYRQIHRRVLLRTLMFLAIYGASIPLAYVNIWIAWACFLILPAMFFWPVVQLEDRPVPAEERLAFERRTVDAS